MISKNMVKRIMENHKGRFNPITRRQILEAMFIPRSPATERELRLVMAELRHEGLPILYATETPAGFYLPINLVDLQEGLDKVRSYIKTECIALRDLKVKGRMYVMAESQQRLGI